VSVLVQEPGGMAGAEGACPILDTHTPESGENCINQSLRKWMSGRVSRRVFSRVIMGLWIPGRYYFLTLTSSPESPPIEKSYDAFRKWLKYQRPGICWCHVFTDEGYGVLHMVIRLKPRMKNLDIEDIRFLWEKNHKAKQIKIIRVKNSNKLANYMADQRKKRKMGSEMSWQECIVRWRWSRGWIPKGFTKTFGRLWHELYNAPDELREKIVREALLDEHYRQSGTKRRIHKPKETIKD